MSQSKNLGKTSFFMILGAILLIACQPQAGAPETDATVLPTATALEAQTQATVQSTTEAPAEAPTALPQPSPTQAGLAGMAGALAEAGLEVNPDPPRGSLFAYNTLAYEIAGMDQAEVVNLTYATHDGKPLTMDVYYPPNTSSDAQLPVVVFGIGYRMSQQPLRNEHFYTSWGKLVAAEGMVGIVYDTEQPDQDMLTVMDFIHENASILRIQPTQIGFWSSSANVPTVMSYLMQEGRSGLQFSIYYYGLSLTPDREYLEALSPSCATRGCLLTELDDVSYVDPELPLFVVKAGRDFIPSINEAMDHFLAYAQDAGAPVTVIDYEDGRHGFDSEQKTEESAEIIAETLAFMKTHFGLQAPPLVLHNGTIVTASGADPIENGAIVIEDGRITAVGPDVEITFPEGATLIDVQGRTILPGLIDARASDLLNRLELTEGRISDVALELYLQSAIRAGVTTVRASGWHWEKQQEIAALKAALAVQGNTVPTVVFAGTSLAHQNGSAASEYYPHQTIGVATAEEARQATEQLIELGVDQINLLQSVTQESGNESHDGLPPTLSPEQLETIVEAAHAHGKRVVGQAVFPEEAALLLSAGVDELANWPSRAVPIPDELIQALVEGAVPVVSGFNVVPPQPGDVRRFLDAGGTMVFGTYAPNSGPLSEPFREFTLMFTNEMTPMEMILSATANAAQAVGLGDVAGTLEAGRWADIIVVDGNPLDDIRAIRDVAYVIKGGELVVQPGMAQVADTGHLE